MSTERPRKTVEIRKIRFLVERNGFFSPVGDWQEYSPRLCSVCEHIAHNLPTLGATGEVCYWVRGSGHDGFCEIK